jgi:peptide/nickel transport system permease protein
MSGHTPEPVQPLEATPPPETEAVPSRLGLTGIARARPGAALAAVFLVAAVIVAVLAPLLGPHDPNAVDLLRPNLSPNRTNWFGTDEVGRDILSRLLAGARVSFGAAALVVVISASVGVPIGLIAGYRPGRVDNVFNRISDGMMSVPALVLAMAFVAAMGPGFFTSMSAVGIVMIPRYFRVARAASRDLVGETFIEASRTLGCSDYRIIFRHVLPNSMGPLIVQTTVVMAAAVLAEAGLSFLGLGIAPPAPSWGGMMAAAQRNPGAVRLLYPPGIALTLTVLALSVIGDALRDWIGGSVARK